MHAAATSESGHDRVFLIHMHNSVHQRPEEDKWEESAHNTTPHDVLPWDLGHDELAVRLARRKRIGPPVIVTVMAGEHLVLTPVAGELAECEEGWGSEGEEGGEGQERFTACCVPERSQGSAIVPQWRQKCPSVCCRLARKGHPACRSDGHPCVRRCCH